MNLAPLTQENLVPRLYLIDGYGFVFRAYHSLPPLTRIDGTPVGAVFGFTNMLMRLKKKISSDHRDYIAVVLDSGSKNFRHDIYPEYKANRPPAPEDLIPQFPLIPEAAEALNLPVLSVKGFEADDIIATYAKAAEAAGMEVVIVSSDKDLMQLVSRRTSMFDAMKDKNIGSKEVEEKFGVQPEKVLDVLSLMGDSSDNIPGVPGIGPKTAAELVLHFGSLDNVLERAGEIPQTKRRETILANIDKAKLSRTLLSLDINAPMPLPLEALKIREEDVHKTLAFLEAQNFTTLAKRYKESNTVDGTSPQSPRANITEKSETLALTEIAAISSLEMLETWLKDLYETGKLSVFYKNEQELHFLGLSKGKNLACEIIATEAQSDSLFDDSGSKSALPLSSVLKLLTPIFENTSVLKIGTNLKSFLHLIACNSTSAIDDIGLISYVLDGSSHPHDLYTLMMLDGLPATNSVGQCAINQSHIHRTLRARLFDEKMLTIYETMERPLLLILYELERLGVKLDAAKLLELSIRFETEIKSEEKQIFALAGSEFNIGSPKQMGEILFEKMQLPHGKKLNKSGAYGTGAEILELLVADGHAIAGHILRWRMLSKLKSTYTDSLIKLIKKDGRVHTSFDMIATSTGRLSSRDPNLQNIPIRTSEGRLIRHAFVAEKGFVLISADYSQIELRLLAHMADIPTLKNAFLNGHDIHAITASQVFGISLSEVTPDLRRRAKTINFGIIYGQSAYGLAAQLGIGRSEAGEYIDSYFKNYPGIKAYMEKTKAEARALGFVTTLFGRKCYIDGIQDKNGAKRQFAERAAINAPLQGTAADIIKRAMIHLSKALFTQNLHARIILQIHDELLLECPEAEAEKTIKLTKSVMENVATLSIPLTAEAKSALNWGEAH